MPCPGRHRIIRLTETGSTNKDAMRLAFQGEPLPLWVAAERQTGGRGRQGRTWTSLPGNLHASVAFATSAPPHAAGQLALVAGLMFYEAVAQTTDLARGGLLRLKWPNDLLIGGAKTGGILVESMVSPPASHASLIVVIGFGLNIVNVPEIDQPVTSLVASGAPVDSEFVLAALAEGCETWLDTWDEGRGFDKIRAAWLMRGGPVGEPISVNTGRGRVSGTFRGVSATGALLVDVDGRLEEFNFGDVALGT
jgi:BirA family transcriptional regulator, biotin operon repressor / biotin---[acetyl-CoA-carboxylase] ligase